MFLITLDLKSYTNGHNHEAIKSITEKLKKISQNQWQLSS